MKLYYAGNVNLEIERMFWEIGAQYRLFSYAEVDKIKKEFAFRLAQGKPPIFLDSGAFGAHTRGVKIDLHKYCEYIKYYGDMVYPVATLDIIGDWKGSARNYDKMLAYGLTNLMPTFHMHSPDHELHRLLQMADYIALGGVVGAHEYQMQPWLDRCFRIIKDYWPKKIHIFGVMAQWALERYPFYSADSSSAVVGGGMGRVSTFDKGKITSIGWIEYGMQTLDGSIMDGITTTFRGVTGSAHHNRRVFNALNQLKLQKHITNVWKNRGITWEDEHDQSTAQSDSRYTNV